MATSRIKMLLKPTNKFASAIICKVTWNILLITVARDLPDIYASTLRLQARGLGHIRISGKSLTAVL